MVLGVGHVITSWETHCTLPLVKTPLDFELGAWGLDDGIFGFVLGIHTQREILI
jgi:hypothetical protein